MLKLNFRVQGEGPPLICLHGLLGSLENLGASARLLAEQFAVHSLDLRNHGRSFHDEEMSYPLMAADVMAYMDSAGLDQAHMLGHSMGGKAAMQCALGFSQRVKRLIVADIAPVGYPPHHEQVLAGLNAIDPGALKSRQQEDELLSGFVPEIGIRQFLLKNLEKNGSKGFRWRMNLTAITTNYPLLMADLQAESSFTGEVIFVRGGLSDYIKPEYHERILELFPRAQFSAIPSAGHWLHAEKPMEFVDIVKRFLLF